MATALMETEGIRTGVLGDYTNVEEAGIERVGYEDKG
jgi:hypothetical protein